MAKAVVKNDALPSFLNDSDNFIQSHIDSFFPPTEESTQDIGLNLTGEDTVGNEVQVEEEVKGAIGTLLDALGQAWDAIVEVLGEVAEAVAEAVQVIWNFIKGVIEPALDLVLDPILEAIECYVNGVEEALQDYLNGNGTAENVVNALSGGMLDKIKALTGKIMWVQNCVKALLDAIEGGMKRVMNFVVGVIGSALRATGGDEYADMVESATSADSVLSVSVISILSTVFSVDMEDYVDSFSGSGLTVLSNSTEEFLNKLGKYVSALGVGFSAIGAYLALSETTILPEIVSLIKATLAMVLSFAGDTLLVEVFQLWLSVDSIITAAIGIGSGFDPLDVASGGLSIIATSVALLDITNRP